MASVKSYQYVKNIDNAKKANFLRKVNNIIKLKALRSQGQWQSITNSFRKWRIAQKGSVWGLDPLKRGVVIEEALGHNLPKNFPIIDKFENGIATSIKSIDLNAATYQNSATLKRKLTGYVDGVAGFNGQQWAGQNITKSMISGKNLEIAVPHGGIGTQATVLNDIVNYGSSLGVHVKVIVIP